MRNALLVAMVLSLPASATAQRRPTGEHRLVEALARGLRLHEAGQHEAALQVYQGARTRFAGNSASLVAHTAQEEIELGLLEDGIRHAIECVARVDTDVNNPFAPTLRRACVELLERVRQRYHRAEGPLRVGAVVVEAPDASPGLVLRLAGQEVPRSLWGQQLPVPVGRVVVQASGPDLAPARTTMAVAAAETRAFRVSSPTRGASSHVAATAGDASTTTQIALGAASPGERAASPARADAGLGQVVLRVEDAPDDTGVALGGFDLPRVWWGHPFPVRPGVVQVDADAQGHGRARRHVAVRAGQRVELTLRLEPTRAPSSEAPPTHAPAVRRTPWLAVTMLGLGVGAAATSGALFAIADEHRAALDASCTGAVARTGCDPALQGREEEGRTLTTAADVLGVAGGVVAVAGAIWWIVAATRTPRAEAPATQAMARRIWNGRTP